MQPDLYRNKPRDFIVDEAHCAITQLKRRQIDCRAALLGDEIAEGVQIVRLLSESPDGVRKLLGRYFVILVQNVSTARFDALQADENFIAATPEQNAAEWAALMQRVYAYKKDSEGRLAFPDGLQPESEFIVYTFTPIVISSEREFLTAQYLFYKGSLPPQIAKDWQLHYGQTAIDNIVRRCKALL